MLPQFQDQQSARKQMKTKTLCVIAVAALILGGAVSADAAIRRIPASYNMLNFYGGYSTPHGEYGEVGLVQFVDNFDRPIEIDADEAFDGTFHFGFDYGTLRAKRFLVLIGFRYTEHAVQQWILDVPPVDFNYRQYDLEFNANYYLVDLTTQMASPYIGAGFQAGMTSTEPDGYDSETDIKVALSLNFGADLKIFQAPNNRSFVTLASMNNYNLVGSDDRPNYLNIGGAIRYWFR